MNTAKRSAASRKGWRTRKRMQATREALRVDYFRFLAERAPPPNPWPEYKRRALPLPEFGKWEK